MAKDKPFSSLGKDFEILESRVAKASVKQVRTVAIGVGSAVIRTTPIDTGRARGNWKPSLGTPVSTFSQSTKGEAPSIAALQSTAARYEKGSLFLTNNLPYIHALNNGWSPQQRVPGWIERTAVTVFDKLQKGWFKNGK